MDKYYFYCLPPLIYLKYYKYNTDMLIRRIGITGRSSCITIPVELMQVLGWKKGDFVGFEAVSEGVVSLRRVALESLSDAQIRLLNQESEK